MTTDPATAADIAALWRAVNANDRRVSEIDHAGTRGLGPVSVQLTEVIKDVGALQNQVAAFERDHQAQHQQEALARVISRRWAVATAIAFLAAIEVPLLYLVHVHP